MKYIVTVNDKNYEVEVEQGAARLLNVTQAVVQAPPATVAAAPVPAAVASPVAAPTASVAGQVVKAPLPGVILNLKKAVGDKVKSGEVLLIIEAMKMENELTAPADGVVAQILTTKGATVSTGDPLLVIQ